MVTRVILLRKGNDGSGGKKRGGHDKLKVHQRSPLEWDEKSRRVLMHY
jgi:hypothetical protein